MKIFGIIIGVLGLYICVNNCICFGVNIYNKKHRIDRFVSPVALCAGIFMFISSLILLPENIRALGFLAFLLDLTYPMLVYSAIATRFFTRKPNNKK